MSVNINKILHKVDPEQHWFLQRARRITASNFGKLFNKSSKGFSVSKSQTAKNLLMKCAWSNKVDNRAIEVLLERDKVSTAALEYGKAYEAAALEQFRRHLKIKEKNFDTSAYNLLTYGDYFGGTPDAVIKGKAVVEMKCPYNPINFFHTLTHKDFYNTDHWWQLQGNMFFAELKKGYYVNYCTLTPPHLAVVEVESTDEITEFFYVQFKRMSNEIKSLLEKK